MSLTCRDRLLSPDRDKGKVFDSKRMPAHSSVSESKNMEPNEIKKTAPREETAEPPKGNR